MHVCCQWYAVSRLLISQREIFLFTFSRTLKNENPHHHGRHHFLFTSVSMDVSDRTRVCARAIARVSLCSQQQLYNFAHNRKPRSHRAESCPLGKHPPRQYIYVATVIHPSVGCTLTHARAHIHSAERADMFTVATYHDRVLRVCMRAPHIEPSRLHYLIQRFL